MKFRTTRPAFPCIGCGPEFSTRTSPEKVAERTVSRFSATKQFHLVGLDFLRSRVLGFDLNVADGENALHRVVGTQKKRAFVRCGAPRAVLQSGKIEVNHPGILGNRAMNRGQPRRSGAVEVDIHLRLQSENGGIGHVAQAQRQTRWLGGG